uniref:Lin-52 DREAM MuvB core complex component n=1 Tax=Ovis aries TaxID=9940 RepID=A0AC11ESP9_SHEEP
GQGFSLGAWLTDPSFPADSWPRHVTWVGRWRLPRTTGRVRKSFVCVTSWHSSISNHRTQISRLPGADLEASLLSFEKLDRASPDLWPEQLPGVAEFAASFKSPITSSPPKWMAEIERDDIDMLKELGSLTTANLMEKVRGLQNLAYQLGLDESREMTRGKFLNILEKPKK